MPPQQPMDLTAVSRAMQPIVAYSINNFLPETILTVGFLLAVIIDLFIRKEGSRKITGYFTLFVFAAAMFAAGMQWMPFHQGKPWDGGKMIFSYSQTLFGPRMEGTNVIASYAMLVVDNFAVFFKLLIAATGIFIVLMSLYSKEINDRRSKFGEYYSLMLAMAVGMFLMPASTDLLMMYISLELVSITSYILAGFMKDTTRGSEASMKYVLFGAFSSGLMLYGISIFYGLTGTTNIIAIQQVLQSGMDPAGHIANTGALWLATVLALAGMGYKISAAPFHFWTPDVYEGSPIPVTALLSVASKAGGFGLLMRFLLFTFPGNPLTGDPIINWPMMIAVVSALTMTLGNFAALQQSNIKRMLAYSTIAHAGYMLIGLVAAGSQAALLGLRPTSGAPGIVAILIYFVAYLFTNLGAFYVVMLIANKIESEEIEDYRGLAKRTPLLCVALALMLVSLTGIPLTIGFVGKLYIFTSILRVDAQGHLPWLWLAVIAILNSVVSLYYYVRVMAAMFIKQSERSTLSDANVGGTLALDSPITYTLGARALLFAFIVPVMVFGIYFTPIVEFTGNVIRFFSVR